MALEAAVDQISVALSVIVAVSIAVERVTEIIKQMVPTLADESSNPQVERLRRAALQVLAAAVGTVIAWQGSLQLGNQGGWGVWALIGLMSSGGSGIWNHTLDAVRAMKVNREAIAGEQLAVQRQAETATPGALNHSKV
jgi:hypothetical protein